MKSYQNVVVVCSNVVHLKKYLLIKVLLMQFKSTLYVALKDHIIRVAESEAELLLPVQL